jgi:pimeloyl-ACP methyl ester carboxylesterase
MPVSTALLVALIAVAGVGLIYQVVGTRRDRLSHPPPGRLVPVNRHDLHLWIMGEEEPTVVLEAGIGASSLSWRLLHAAVARFARVCAYDRAGLGWSQPGPAGRSGRRSVAELRRALAGAHLDPPYVLVGHSFGAYLVRLFTALHPEDVAGLVLVDPLDPEDWREPTRAARRRLGGGIFCARVGSGLAFFGIVRFATHQFLRGGRRLPRAVLSSFPKEATPVIEGLVRQIAKLPAEYWPAIQAHWSRTWSLWTLGEYLAALPECAREVIAAEQRCRERGDSSAEPASSRDIPIVVLSASTASPVAQDRHRATAARYRSGRHHTVAAGGHWLQLDAPDAVVDAIREVVNAARDGALPYPGGAQAKDE